MNSGIMVCHLLWEMFFPPKGAREKIPFIPLLRKVCALRKLNLETQVLKGLIRVLENRMRRSWDKNVWKEERKKIITPKSKCEYCGKKENLHVHHPSYKYKNPEDYSELKDTESILILCKKCHYILHKHGKR